MCYQGEAWASGDTVGNAKAAVVKLNTGSSPPVLPTSRNENTLCHVMWKNDEITGVGPATSQEDYINLCHLGNTGSSDNVLHVSTEG